MAKKTGGAALKTAIRAVRNTPISQFWEDAQNASPTFATHTAHLTNVEFSEKGFEAIKSISGLDLINEFYGVSMRVALNIINVARAKNPLVDKGLVEVFEEEYTAFSQRLGIDSVKPVSPGWMGIKDGDTRDMYKVRLAEVSERFFQINFQYQAWVTIRDEFEARTLFSSEYGLGSFYAGILQALANGYTKQEYLNVAEAINSALNSSNWPLLDTQKIYLSTGWDTNPTKEQMKELIRILKDIASDMDSSPSLDGYNAMGFDTALDPNDHVLILRTGIKNILDTALLEGVWNLEYMSFPFEVIEMKNFGGMVPYITSNDELIEAQPVYDGNGTVVGFIDKTATLNAPAYKDGGVWKVNATIDGVTANVTIPTKPDYEHDPNPDLLGTIMQKGAVLEISKNPYSVESTPHNPYGLYMNMFANRPNTIIAVDPLYTMIPIYKGTTPEPVENIQKVQIVNSDPIDMNLKKIGGATAGAANAPAINVSTRDLVVSADIKKVNGSNVAATGIPVSVDGVKGVSVDNPSVEPIKTGIVNTTDGAMVDSFGNIMVNTNNPIGAFITNDSQNPVPTQEVTP